MSQKEMLGNRMSQQERFPTNLILDQVFLEQKMWLGILVGERVFFPRMVGNPRFTQPSFSCVGLSILRNVQTIL
jgi:hypothetical protein